MRHRLAAALAVLLAGTALPAAAAGLSGMGAAIFGNGFSFARANLEATPVKAIAVGALKVGLQTTRLVEVQKAFGGTLRSGGGATWLCYHADGANSWFISNAFGGQEFVMMVAVESSTRTPADCEAAGDKFVLPDFGVPGLGAKAAELKATFGAAPSGSKAAYRADRAGGYADIAQYLGYALKGGTVTGFGVGETSIPTTH